MGKILKSLLFLNNYFPTRVTPVDDIKSLIKKLRPIVVPNELIRIGPDSDGGYIVPNDLQNIAKCFSPGVSNECGFEKNCARRGIPVFMADWSVERPPLNDKRFHFTKKFIGAYNNDKFMTFNEWVTMHTQLNEEILIQMDIEGFEYEVLLSADSEILKSCRILIVEFHNLDQLWNRIFFNMIARVFDKILQTHDVVHIHPNNSCDYDLHKGIQIPRAMEFTFYNKRYARKKVGYSTIPHPLDRDNVTDKPSIELSPLWYQSKNEFD